MISNEFESPLDGLKLYRNVFPPEVKPRAAIVFAHGMLEHSGRHADWASRFAEEHRIAVIAPDARGHGKSGGKRAWVDTFNDFVADYVQTLRDVAQKFPDVPLFAMGMSMGGAIATLSALKKQSERPKLAGLVLVAPAIRFQGKMFPALHFTASMLDYFIPKIWVAKPNFGILSRNVELVQSFRKDPLVYKGQILLHFGTEILKAMKRIQRRACEIDLPLLVLQGTKDWVVTPSGAVDFVEAASSTDKTLQLYDGLYHELLHEPEQEQILGDIVRWIEERESPACFFRKNR